MAERRGARDPEEVSVEVYGRGEKGGDIEERGETKKRNRAPVAIRHDAPDRTVVGDPRVAQLHRFDHNFNAGGFGDGGIRLALRRGIRVWNVKVEEPHRRLEVRVFGGS